MAQPPASLAARALWYVAPGSVELRDEILRKPAEGEVLVATSFSGVSRGTERLVMAGKVGQAEWQRMRAPMQAGDFPFPVKYGYCATGVVEAGDKDLIGRPVFVLHPHQDRFIAPASMACPIPAGVPIRRATLAANMETALNALWDAGAAPADHVVVVGGGIVGLLVGYLAARIPGTQVTLVDVAEDRRALAESLGMRFSLPHTAPSGRLPEGKSEGANQYDADVVFHTSASAPGLATAIGAAGMEATIVELSWYGAGTVAAPLGDAFHSRRLKLISSQVGHVSAGRRIRWSYRRRLLAALELLKDDRLDALITEEIALADAPAKLPALLGRDAKGLAPVLRY